MASVALLVALLVNEMALLMAAMWVAWMARKKVEQTAAPMAACLVAQMVSKWVVRKVGWLAAAWVDSVAAVLVLHSGVSMAQ